MGCRKLMDRFNIAVDRFRFIQTREDPGHPGSQWTHLRLQHSQLRQAGNATAKYTREMQLQPSTGTCTWMYVVRNHYSSSFTFIEVISLGNQSTNKRLKYSQADNENVSLETHSSFYNSRKTLEAHGCKPWVTNLLIVSHTLSILTANITYCIILLQYVNESQVNVGVVQ